MRKGKRNRRWKNRKIKDGGSNKRMRKRMEEDRKMGGRGK